MEYGGQKLKSSIFFLRKHGLMSHIFSNTQTVWYFGVFQALQHRSNYIAQTKKQEEFCRVKLYFGMLFFKLVPCPISFFEAIHTLMCDGVGVLRSYGSAEERCVLIYPNTEDVATNVSSLFSTLLLFSLTNKCLVVLIVCLIVQVFYQS